MTGEPIIPEPTLSEALVRLSKEKPMENHNDPANSSVKPGTATTEFYLSIAAQVVGLALIVLPMVLKPGEQSEMILKVIGGIAIVLGNLGYTVPRAMHKTAVAEGAAAVAIEKIRASVPTQPTSP